MDKIKVRIHKAYGKELIYPVCDKAKLFCDIAGAKSLTRDQVESVKALGFEVEAVVQEVVLQVTNL